MKKILVKLTLFVVILLLAFSSYLMANNNNNNNNIINNNTINNITAKDKERVLTQLVMHSLASGHYSPVKIDDRFSVTTFNHYLKNLDPSKRFLYQSDIDDFDRYRLKIDDQINTGDTDFLDLTTATCRKRIEEVKGFYLELLNQPFDYQANESLELDPEKRGYCHGKGELKELWRKLLKYQTLTVYWQLAQENKDQAQLKKLKGQIDPQLEAEARKKVVQDIKRNLNRLLQETRIDQLERYMDNVTASFDPHTTYMAPQSQEEFNIDMTGTLEGIGAQLQEQENGDYIKVEKVIPGSPAWRGKQLKEGDLILKVAEGSGEPVDIANMRVTDVVKLIRGKKGTMVKLTVRKPDGRIVVIAITRDIVVIEDSYAKSALIQNKKIGKTFGYISLPSFYRDFSNEKGRNSAEDMRKELQKLNKAKVSGIILDLRNNGGGSLPDAIQISGLFIKDGPVVQVRERSGKVEVLKDVDPDIVYQGPLVVLVNSLSASASEILAAALQDYGRAVIIGTNSFGKGTVQNLIDLDQLADRMLPSNFAAVKPLGSLKLTIQKFYRVNGGSTQFKGVIADVALPDQLSYYDVGERKLDNYLPYDTVKPVAITTWPKKYNLTVIRVRSAKRVKASKVFALVNSNITQLQQQKKQTLQALQLQKIVAQQETLKDQTDQLTKMQTVKAYLKVWEPAKNSAKDDWLQRVNKDSYIEEASYILNDLMRQ
jgi:carboxyl-terminal processing protease